MAKEGRKLELYEILAAKRAKGKVPLGLDVPVKQANTPDPQPEALTDAPGLIIDDAVGPLIAPSEKPERPRAETVKVDPPPPVRELPPAPPQEPVQPEPQRPRPEAQREYGEPRQTRRESKTRKVQERPAPPQPAPVPEYVEPEPRPRSPREVVFALDTALIFFTVILALVGCSYFIGYKRGQEEKPAGLAGAAEIEMRDPARITFRNLGSGPRTTIRPPEQDYTLIIRKEPATDNDIPERLELELAEALQRGKQQSGKEIPGFIFRTAGNDPHYILAVGLGQTANDQNLNELLQVYYAMEGVTLSREPKPYRGCRIAPIRELGTPVY